MHRGQRGVVCSRKLKAPPLRGRRHQQRVLVETRGSGAAVALTPLVPMSTPIRVGIRAGVWVWLGLGLGSGLPYRGNCKAGLFGVSLSKVLKSSASSTGAAG